MPDFLLLKENYLFIITLLVILAIGIIESIAFIFGISFFGALEIMFLPSPGKSTKQDQEIKNTKYDKAKSRAKIPIIISLILFLTSFTCIGFLIQYVTYTLWHTFMPWFFSVIPALIIACLTVISSNKIFGPLLYMALIKFECTSVVSSVSFIGQCAIITTGNAKKGVPAEAKVRDYTGKTHYILVEPETEHDVFEKCSRVVLVKKLSPVVFVGEKKENNFF